MSEINNIDKPAEPSYIDPLADEALLHLSKVNPDLATRLESLEQARRIAKARPDEISYYERAGAREPNLLPRAK